MRISRETRRFRNRYHHHQGARNRSKVGLSAIKPKRRAQHPSAAIFAQRESGWLAITRIFLAAVRRQKAAPLLSYLGLSGGLIAQRSIGGGIITEAEIKHYAPMPSGRAGRQRSAALESRRKYCRCEGHCFAALAGEAICASWRKAIWPKNSRIEIIIYIAVYLSRRRKREM